MVFGIGPAGTGKTFLAMMRPSMPLPRRNPAHCSRPSAVEAEALGFLPGDLEEKLLPYLRPLYDAMDECHPVEARKLVETGS